METWKLLLITLLLAVVLGCIVGIVTGKHQAKKAAGRARPLLNKRERLIYSLCILLGTACILFGIFIAPNLMQPDDGILTDEFGNPVGAELVEGEAAVGGGGTMVGGRGGRAVVRGGGGTATAVYIAG